MSLALLASVGIAVKIVWALAASPFIRCNIVAALEPIKRLRCQGSYGLPLTVADVGGGVSWLRSLLRGCGC